jgi:ribosomal protein S12 methylthiotransferase accessory factor
LLHILFRRLFMFHETQIWAEAPSKETEASETLKTIVDFKTGIVRALIEYARRNDEPKFFTYTAWLCNTVPFSDVNVQRYSASTALTRHEAMMKALGEAVERYCSAVYRVHDFVYASYRELGDRAVAPQRFLSFSQKQMAADPFQQFRFDDDTRFRWVQGYSLTQHRPLYVPAQLIYVPYVYTDEPMLRFPISAGKSLGPSYAWALYHGICELVERDAWMITYLNKLPREQVELEASHNETLAKMNPLFRKYGLDLYVYDITTDIPIPSMLAILVDRSGRGPTLLSGASTGLDPEDAVIGAIEEAQQLRPSLQDVLLRNSHTREILQVKRNPNLIRCVYELPGGVSGNLLRLLYWSGLEMIDELDFLLNSDNKKRIDDIPNASSTDLRDNLRTVLDVLEKRNCEVIFVDVTTPDVKCLGLKVVSVVIPELMPLYLDEAYKYLGNERLYSVPKTLGYRTTPSREEDLNPIPHPFV